MKKRTRIQALFLAVLIGILPLTGCGTENSQLESRDSSSSSESSSVSSSSSSENEVVYPTAYAVVKEEDAADLPEFDRTEEYTAVCNAVNEFSFRMTEALLEDAGENLVCSPISAAFALAALLNGVEDESAQRSLLDTMCLNDMSMDEVNQGFSMLLSKLTVPNRYQLEDDPTYTTPVEIANAVFVSQNHALKKEYAQTAQDYYRSETLAVDFTSQDAVHAVNDWCNEKTHGVIPSIVDALPSDTISAIANAIYFSDRWDWEFDPEQNETRTFHADSGDAEATFMVREGDFLPYFEDDRMQVIELEFTRHGGLTILLPKQGTCPVGESGTGNAKELLASMDAESYAALLNNLPDQKGVLRIPKFKLDAFLDLKDALDKLGFSELFDDPILDGLVDDMSLNVSTALQKALIDVSETGTTAAAVTIMIETGGAPEIPDNDPFEMNCDRPFAFILHDQSGSILFTGICGNIQSES